MLSFLFVQTYGFSQSLQGMVTTSSNEPLSFASIAVLNPSDSSLQGGTIASVDGTFSLALSKGTHLLNISMTGFLTQAQFVRLEDEPLLLEVTLEEDIASLDEVVVTSRKPLFEKEIDRTIVNVQSSVTNAGVSALEVLSKSPGVIVDRISNNLSLNGKSGTLIFVNGKRVRLTEQSLIQYLEGLPSGSIEKLELFANPPASYDAEGNAGIINIVLIQDETVGTNGSLSIFSGYGLRPKFGGTFGLNSRSERFGYFLDFSSSNDYTRQDLTIQSITRQGSEEFTNDLYSRRPAYIGAQRLNAGLDYRLNATSLLGITTSGALRAWSMDATTFSDFSDAGREGSSVNQNTENNDWSDLSVGLNYKTNPSENSTFSVYYDYLRYDNNNPTDYLEEEFDTSGQLLISRPFLTRKKTPFVFHVGKTDYSHKISDLFSIEAGVKGTFTNFENDLRFYDVVVGVPLLAEGISDIFTLDERILASYVSSELQVSNNLTVKGGLRFENTSSQLKTVDEGVLFDRDNNRIFPTLYVSRKLGEFKSISLSYARRIVRPSFNALAPAFTFIDSRSVYTGNPLLRSILSDQLKLAYNHKDLNLSVEYTDNRNPIAWAQPNFDENGVQFIVPQHLADLKTINYSVDYAYDFASWFSSRLSAGLNWQHVESLPESGGPLTLETTFLTANLTQIFKLEEKLTLEVNSNLQTSRQVGVNSTADIISFNLGLQKEFKNRSKLSINVSDVFDLGSHFELTTDGAVENDFFDWRYELEGNVVRVNYSVLFGKNTWKFNRKRVASDEERSRLN